MAVRGIHHVGIAVDDLDAAIERYASLFGATLEHRDRVEDQGVEAASLRVGGSRVELLAPLGADTPVGRFLAKRGPGMHHVAFEAELERRGVTFYSDVNVVDEGVLAGWRWVYFADPDGYPLELVENAYERPGGHAEGIRRYLETRR